MCVWGGCSGISGVDVFLFCASCVWLTCGVCWLCGLGRSVGYGVYFKSVFQGCASWLCVVVVVWPWPVWHGGSIVGILVC